MGVYVTDHGADNTGATDCTAAFQAAIASAVASGKRSVSIPPGTYKVTQAGALTIPTPVNGFVFEGAGMGLSTIRFVNSDGETLPEDNYLYVNDDQDLKVMFKGLRFEGDQTNKNSRFMYMTSDGIAQSVRFLDVQWAYFENIATIEGELNASELLYIGCKSMVSYGAQFVIDNPQSLNHCYHGCDFESAYGDIWHFKAGGMLNVYGGSLIMGGNGEADGAVLHLDDVVGSGIGSSNATFNFFGVKTELKDDSQFLNGQARATVTLVGCNTEVITDDDSRVAYTLLDGCNLVVNGGRFNGKVHLQAINASSYAQAGRPAVFSAVDTYLGVNFEITRDDVANAGGEGRAVIQRCKRAQTTGVHDVLDQDDGIRGGSHTAASRSLYAVVRAGDKTGGLPQQTTAIGLKLPLGSVILSLRLYHPAQAGGTEQVYYLRNADADTIEDWTFDANSLQTTKTDLYYVCDTENRRTLSFVGDAGNAAASYSGYLLVEYVG